MRRTSFHFLGCFSAYGTNASFEAYQMRSDVTVSTGCVGLWVCGWATGNEERDITTSCGPELARCDPYRTRTHFNRPVDLLNHEPV